MLNEILPTKLTQNIFKMIGSDWMLITAGGTDSYNTMTASWGGMGVLWNKSVAFIFVRPQRHTYGFVEVNDGFTLSFFDEQHRDALQFCGSHSGRDCDKAKTCGLTPITINGKISFEQARLIFVCTKLYGQNLCAENFVQSSLLPTFYPNSDFHKMYVGEITNIYINI